jgi:hypothetical protein
MLIVVLTVNIILSILALTIYKPFRKLWTQLDYAHEAILSLIFRALPKN